MEKGKEERAGGRREGKDGGEEGRRKAEGQFEIHANWASLGLQLASLLSGRGAIRC